MTRSSSVRGTIPARAYAGAYDAETGQLRWRFNPVPGDPAKGFENAAMAKAANTWSGEWWRNGGGGQVWDSIIYDPDFDRLYTAPETDFPTMRASVTRVGVATIFSPSRSSL